jgi:glyoxylase-like metal-dependent hydrolase (beta-lactamase superfamily II)
MPPFVQRLDHGVHVIDTGFHRPMFDAAYLLVEGGRAAFIDTGTNHALPRLLAALEAAGLEPGAVDYIIPTHVHLDHAGGVGALARELPAAQVLVHARGVRHLVDPAQLSAGARAVYGDEEFERSYGEIVPVPAARIVATHDGMEVALAGRPLRFLDTPGHARHHHCIWDERSRGFFTGDTFGLSYGEFDSAQGPWLLPTTTPVQFEPEVLCASVRRMLGYAPQCMYLTHYGRLGDVARLGATLLEQIDDMVAIGTELRTAPGRHAALKQALAEHYLAIVARHGVAMPRERVLELLAVDLELNAQGLAIWLDRAAVPAR